MDSFNNIASLPLSRLTCESKNLLSFLLSAKKVLPTDGPIKLPRDWRGLANLVNISAEVAASLSDYQDHTKVLKVLELWIQNDNSATVGQLLEYLQKIDRYDILDDLLELAKSGKLVASNVSKKEPVAECGGKQVPVENVSERITFDDLGKQLEYYSAFVLYAKEDQDFVDELMLRMRQFNHKICTEDDILPGFSTQIAPVMELIKERCYRTIIVLSPDFLSSPANKFFMNFVQALSIKQRSESLIPCVVRPCSKQDMPLQMEFYHKLYYNPTEEKPAYNFWHRLNLALKILPPVQVTDVVRTPTIAPAVQATMRITEMSSDSACVITSNTTQTLSLPSVPSSCLNNSQSSLTGRDTTCTDSSTLPLTGREKKKSTIKKLVNRILPGRSKKKAVQLMN